MCPFLFFCVKNIIKKSAWKNRQAKASLCYLNLTAADPWQELHLWRAQGSKELDCTNGKTWRKIFSPYLCAQRELPGSYKIHYSDSSQIFWQIIYQWTWPGTAINSALILESSIPVPAFPGSRGFGHGQWRKPPLTPNGTSQECQCLSNPAPALPLCTFLCLQGLEELRDPTPPSIAGAGAALGMDGSTACAPAGPAAQAVPAGAGGQRRDLYIAMNIVFVSFIIL